MHFESLKKVQVFPGACEGTGSYFFHQTLMAAPSSSVTRSFFTVVYGGLDPVQVFGLQLVKEAIRLLKVTASSSAFSPSNTTPSFSPSSPNTASSNKSEETVSEETVIEEAVILLLPLRFLLLILPLPSLPPLLPPLLTLLPPTRAKKRYQKKQ
jgi:hypothetical protein